MTTLEADLPYVVGKYLESVLLQLSAQANYPAFGWKQLCGKKSVF
jgi:hypothetical protein